MTKLSKADAADLFTPMRPRQVAEALLSELAANIATVIEVERAVAAASHKGADGVEITAADLRKRLTEDGDARQRAREIHWQDT